MGNRKEGRSTVYNSITSEEKLRRVNPENIQLENDFLEYLASTDKSKETIKQYKSNLHIFWCWNLENNANKFFVNLTKRELSKFQSYAISTWGWSPRRIRTVKATLSSMSNYIENILDDEFENYKSIIGKIESPVDTPVREKTVFSEKELNSLLDHLVENKEYMKACALSLAMNGGRRKAELRRFKVDYFKPEYTICNGALYKTPEKVKTKGRGSIGKMLELFTLASPFNHYLKLWLEEREHLGIKSEWLFPKYKDGKWIDEPVSISALDSWARSFTLVLGRPFYWHSMRHYFTTKLISCDIPSTVIQDVIGWDSADMVNRYDDTEKDERFEKYFGGDGIKKVKSARLEEL